MNAEGSHNCVEMSAHGMRYEGQKHVLLGHTSLNATVCHEPLVMEILQHLIVGAFQMYEYVYFETWNLTALDKLTSA